MRIRDEVHRRAISYHRKLRGKEQLDSTLLQIPGLGRKRVEALLTHFKNVEEIAEADEQDIAKIGGIGLKLAKTIKRFLKDE
jgi:excinuclease ABC subunit C